MSVVTSFFNRPVLQQPEEFQSGTCTLEKAIWQQFLGKLGSVFCLSCAAVAAKQPSIIIIIVIEHEFDENDELFRRNKLLDSAVLNIWIAY